jgi:hypothetical protein
MGPWEGPLVADFSSLVPSRLTGALQAGVSRHG